MALGQARSVVPAAFAAILWLVIREEVLTDQRDMVTLMPGEILVKQHPCCRPATIALGSASVAIRSRGKTDGRALSFGDRSRRRLAGVGDSFGGPGGRGRRLRRDLQRRGQQ